MMFVEVLRAAWISREFAMVPKRMPADLSLELTQTSFFVPRQKEMIEPSVKGALNLLESVAKAKTVKKVVLTSSSSSVRFRPDYSPDVPLDDKSWSSIPFCTQFKVRMQTALPSSMTDCVFSTSCQIQHKKCPSLESPRSTGMEARSM